MEFMYPPPPDEWCFETFCLRFLRSYWKESEPQFYGRRGQRQDGVDIIDESGAEPLRGAQCKFKSIGEILSANEVESEIAKAREFSPPLGHYFVLTTSRRSTDVQRAVLRLNQEHRRRKLFRISVLTWDRIEEFLREHPDVYSRIIDPTINRMVETIDRRFDGIAVRVDELLLKTSGGEFNDRLESARVHLEEHDRQAARIVLRQLQTTHWNELSDRQRFLALTYLAKVEYASGNWHEAGRLHIEAKAYQPHDERARIALCANSIGSTSVQDYLLRRATRISVFDS